MTEAEMVARLLVARGGRDVESNINSVIEWLCVEYRSRVMSVGDPSLLVVAAGLLNGRIERGVDLDMEAVQRLNDQLDSQ